jgi:DNA modification methylase
MAGSGTTLDVARDLGRRALGYDLQPPRKDVFRADARRLPLEDGKADFVFVDPPYSDHLTYSGQEECIGGLSADRDDYYGEMAKVVAEIDRVLRPERYLALYVSDSFRKGRPFQAIGFRLFGELALRFTPVDAICVTRHNAKLFRNHWHTAAVEGNYFLRGFNHLFIFYKEGRDRKGKPLPDRRDPEEVSADVEMRTPAGGSADDSGGPARGGRR